MSVEIRKNDVITLIRRRDQQVRHGRVDLVRKVDGREVVHLDQKHRRENGERGWGQYFLDECDIMNLSRE